MRVLSEYDVEVSSSKDGYEVLGRLLKERFDILITSLHIPTIDAVSLFRVLEIVSHSNSSIKTIVVTSSKQHANKIQRNDLVILEKGASLESDVKQTLKAWAPQKSQINANLFADKCKIMVIDDSPDVHQLAKISLKKFANIQLLHCQDPMKAEALIISEKPDLILLDVQMPGLSGDQLLLQLQEKHLLNNTLVVFLTATDTKSELARLATLGPRAILRKPFSPKLLVQHLHEIFERKAA